MSVRISKDDAAIIYACMRTMLDTLNDYLVSIENPCDLDIDDFNILIDAKYHVLRISSLLDKLRLVIDNE